MDDFLAAFLPRFKAGAAARLERSIELALKRDPEAGAAIARDLHAVAGEAGLLGVHTIVSLARVGEAHAKRMHATRSNEAADALMTSLTELKRAIELEPDGRTK